MSQRITCPEVRRLRRLQRYFNGPKVPLMQDRSNLGKMAILPFSVVIVFEGCWGINIPFRLFTYLCDWGLVPHSRRFHLQGHRQFSETRHPGMSGIVHFIQPE